MSENSKCTINSAVLSSPIGNYLVEACHDGIHSISLESGVNNDNFETKGDFHVRVIKGKGPTTTRMKEYPMLRNCYQWLEEYFMYFNPESGRSQYAVPICKEVADPNSGTFRERVWLTLMENVKFGETITYDNTEYDLLETNLQFSLRPQVRRARQHGREAWRCEGCRLGYE